MATFKLKAKINILAVVAKVVTTVLGLWVGGLIMDKVAVAMNGSSGGFFQGFTLIGFNTMNGSINAAGQWTCSPQIGTSATCLNGTVNTTGILSVVGIISMAAIVMDFVEFRL